MPDDQIYITLPNTPREAFPKGITGLAIAQHLCPHMADDVLAIAVEGATWDATRPIMHDATVQLLTWEDAAGKRTFWHSSAHLMAEAILACYPDAKLGIGPAVEGGFYYDVDFGNNVFTHDDLAKVEKRMRALARRKDPYLRREVSRQEAMDHFAAQGATYKLEILEALVEGPITFYQQGGFVDLCRGPHLPHTGYIKGIRLTAVAGAYWRGDSSRKQLTRIYGITFPQVAQLEAHERAVAAAKERDHRKLGKELGIFTFSDEVGLGLPLWLPRGAFIKEQLVQFMRQEQQKRGYLPVHTPHIGRKELYITSGHYDKYGSDAFQPITTPQEGTSFLLRPMNCPHHCAVYKCMPHSYRELPIRLAEFGTVYRYEQHGELHGLTRTRGFTQDDAHIFCRADQVKGEFVDVINLVRHVFQTFGFSDYRAQLSLRDPQQATRYLGDPTAWEAAERAVREAAEECNLPTEVVLGEAAFYGPKLDFMVRDALGRWWQLGTVQLDYQLPLRFDLTYVGEDNRKHRPVLIHRAPFGSLERFIGLLLEHTGGRLPLWLCAEQVMILPIAEEHRAYAEVVAAQLRAADLRVKVDARTEKIGRKIRDAARHKIPYSLIIGKQEVEAQCVAVRQHGKGQQGSMSVSSFVAHCLEEHAGGIR